jgi:hypothetical protein
LEFEVVCEVVVRGGVGVICCVFDMKVVIVGVVGFWGCLMFFNRDKFRILFSGDLVDCGFLFDGLWNRGWFS